MNYNLILISSFFWIIPIFYVFQYLLNIEFAVTMLITFGILIPTWLICIIRPEQLERKRLKKLKDDGKYEISVPCQNCLERNWYVLKQETCLKEFLPTQKCKYCKCIMQSQSFTEVMGK